MTIPKGHSQLSNHWLEKLAQWGVDEEAAVHAGLEMLSDKECSALGVSEGDGLVIRYFGHEDEPEVLTVDSQSGHYGRVVSLRELPAAFAYSIQETEAPSGNSDEERVLHPSGGELYLPRVAGVDWCELVDDLCQWEQLLGRCQLSVA